MGNQFYEIVDGLDRCLERFNLVGALPGEIQVIPAEVTVGGRLAVDRVAQVEVMDDRARAQVEDLADGFGDLLIIHRAGAEGFHVDAERVRHADGVGQLDLAARGQPGGDHVLGHPARGIGRGAVHLRGILAAESAAAVASHAAVGIHDDLAPGHARVAHRPADHESARSG